MSDRSQGEAALVQFSERLTNSAAFGTLFREGMDLVEETAAYLDGAGRAEAKALDGSANHSSPPRQHDPCPGDRTRRDRQSAGAAAQSPEGGVRAILAARQIKTPRREPRRLIPFPEREA